MQSRPAEIIRRRRQGARQRAHGGRLRRLVDGRVERRARHEGNLHLQGRRAGRPRAMTVPEQVVVLLRALVYAGAIAVGRRLLFGASFPQVAGERRSGAETPDPRRLPPAAHCRAAALRCVSARHRRRRLVAGVRSRAALDGLGDADRPGRRLVRLARCGRHRAGRLALASGRHSPRRSS